MRGGGWMGKVPHELPPAGEEGKKSLIKCKHAGRFTYGVSLMDADDQMLVIPTVLCLMVERFVFWE